MQHGLKLQRRSGVASAISIQARVIGALILRELHTRYGRENIGYLWLVAEPLMLGTVISLLHNQGAATAVPILRLSPWWATRSSFCFAP